MTTKSTDRWEIVVLSDEDVAILVNVLRDTVAYLAESLGYEGRIPFDIAAFDPEGNCMSEYVFDPGEME